MNYLEEPNDNSVIGFLKTMMKENNSTSSKVSEEGCQVLNVFMVEEGDNLEFISEKILIIKKKKLIHHLQISPSILIVRFFLRIHDHCTVRKKGSLQ